MSTTTSTGDVSSSTAAVIPTAAAVTVQHLSAKAFAERLNQPHVVLLDVRTPAEYGQGHLAKSKNLNMQAPDFAQQIASLDKSATYALYCQSGIRSNIAGQQMITTGITKIIDLSGGITAWTAEGNPITKS